MSKRPNNDVEGPTKRLKEDDDEAALERILQSIENEDRAQAARRAEASQLQDRVRKQKEKREAERKQQEEEAARKQQVAGEAKQAALVVLAQIDAVEREAWQKFAGPAKEIYLSTGSWKESQSLRPVCWGICGPSAHSIIPSRQAWEALQTFAVGDADTTDDILDIYETLKQQISIRFETTGPMYLFECDDFRWLLLQEPPAIHHAFLAGDLPPSDSIDWPIDEAWWRQYGIIAILAHRLLARMPPRLLSDPRSVSVRYAGHCIQDWYAALAVFSMRIERGLTGPAPILADPPSAQDAVTLRKEAEKHNEQVNFFSGEEAIVSVDEDRAWWGMGGS
ncbi:hypothetical protein BDZ85DRAFT_259081 [Elsinoe ampelina]|uniref:Uncharacterized protein n=1 Tax=Elsinoe ampelina TaxID=302913 RepID=A0A6A6GH18_9PEZI|nr:hypothetical protein BDZ85DRAFT_259081 [Elsinoe ampelina]